MKIYVNNFVSLFLEASFLYIGLFQMIFKEIYLIHRFNPNGY